MGWLILAIAILVVFSFVYLRGENLAYLDSNVIPRPVGEPSEAHQAVLDQMVEFAAAGHTVSRKDRIPAISGAMIERVGSDLAEGGLLALFVGPFVGTPYKIYAAKAAGAGIGFVHFLLVSIPARLLRFALVSLIVGWISKRPLSAWSRPVKLWLLGGFWVVFYLLFLTLMPS